MENERTQAGNRGTQADGDDTSSARSCDEHVDRLADLFLEHPAWLAAARRIREGASSKVFFSHRAGEPWQLVRRGEQSLLLSGPARDPDFAFLFTPVAIERLAAVQGGVADFAVELFSLILETDEELRIGFRIIAPFPRLARRGYLGLLITGGPKILAFGATHGIRTLGALRRFVAQMRARKPESWEVA
jgi:hypothetical protein